MKRKENESMKEYRKRRQADKINTEIHLKGVLIWNASVKEKQKRTYRKAKEQ